MLFQFLDKQDCFLFNLTSKAELPLALGRGQSHVNGEKGKQNNTTNYQVGNRCEFPRQHHPIKSKIPCWFLADIFPQAFSS